MNPPFGDMPRPVFEYLGYVAPDSKRDILAAFLSISLMRLLSGGIIGAITKREPLFTRGYENWRQRIFFGKSKLQTFVDLGGGVLDGATVETAAYTIGTSAFSRDSIFLSKAHNSKIQQQILSLHEGSSHGKNLILPLSTFESIPTKPLAYDTPEEILKCYTRLDPLAPAIGRTAQGAGTTDDFRFCRLLHEVNPSSVSLYRKIMQGENDVWVPYLKGKPAIPFFSDVNTLLKWGNDGAEVKEYNRMRYGSASRNITNEGEYGRAGIVFPRRTSRFSPRLMPGGCIFSKGGQCVFSDTYGEHILLAILSSTVVNELFKPMLGRADMDAQYEVGAVGSLPISGIKIDENIITPIIETLIGFWHSHFSFSEESAYFRGLIVSKSKSIKECFTAYCNQYKSMENSYKTSLRKLDETIGNSFANAANFQMPYEWISHEEVSLPRYSLKDYSERLLSFAFGVSIGRFNSHENINIQDRKTDIQKLQLEPEVLSPFVASSVANKQFRVLADDDGSENDIKILIRITADLVGIGQSECLNELSENLRKMPRKWISQDFFKWHILRYSAQGRKAPIYWQFSTTSNKYSIWFYYHQLTKDTFYEVLNEVVIPKHKFEERALSNLRQQYGNNPDIRNRREISDQEEFVSELSTFKEELTRIAPLWNPDLNDGVIINFAPLWRIVPQNKPWQKECKKIWDKLVKGDYDWAHLAMHLWPERVVKKCAKDRSLAIAHDLDESFWKEDDKGKWKPKKVSKEIMDSLIQERTSPTVKAALEELLKAPIPANMAGKKRKKKA